MADGFTHKSDSRCGKLAMGLAGNRFIGWQVWWGGLIEG
jgi:hypothetical protein